MSTVIPENTVARWLLILVLLAGVYFFGRFLVPVLAALIIGFASWPLYVRLLNLCKNNHTLAATLAIFIIVIAIVVPIAFVFSYAMQEVRQWLAWLIEANRVGASMPEWIAALPGVGEWLQPYWEETLGKPHALSDWIQLVSGEHLGNIYRLLLNFGGRAFEWVLSLLFMLITLFFI